MYHSNNKIISRVFLPHEAITNFVNCQDYFK